MTTKKLFRRPSAPSYGICPFCGHPLRLNKNGIMVYCSQLRWHVNAYGEMEATGPCQFRFMTTYSGKPVNAGAVPLLGDGGQRHSRNRS